MHTLTVITLALLAGIVAGYAFRLLTIDDRRQRFTLTTRHPSPHTIDDLNATIDRYAGLLRDTDHQLQLALRDKHVAEMQLHVTDLACNASADKLALVCEISRAYFGRNAAKGLALVREALDQ